MFELAVVLSRSSGLHAACSNQLRDLPSVSFCAASPSSHRPVVVSKFESGQQVWIAGRAATFLYHDREEAAVIRYQGEQATRVDRGLSRRRPADSSYDSKRKPGGSGCHVLQRARGDLHVAPRHRQLRNVSGRAPSSASRMASGISSASRRSTRGNVGGLSDPSLGRRRAPGRPLFARAGGAVTDGSAARVLPAPMRRPPRSLPLLTASRGSLNRGSLHARF